MRSNNDYILLQHIWSWLHEPLNVVCKLCHKRQASITRIYRCMCVWMRVYVRDRCVCVQVCVSVHVRACVWACLCVSVCAHVCASKRVHMCACMCARASACTYLVDHHEKTLFPKVHTSCVVRGSRGCCMYTPGVSHFVCNCASIGGRVFYARC
jgi:hypothetical protein